MESAERYPQPLQIETPLPLPPKPLRRILFKLPPPPPPHRTAALAIMEAKFRHAVMKLARDNANRVILTRRHKSLIDRTLTEFLADFRTPDHPPYAAMIQRAIRELKEKGGSTEESISRYIKKEYTDLPWAHNTLLKHHLGNLCDDGEIIVLRKRFYLLAGANPCPRSSNIANEKPKRKQRSAPGRMRSKRRTKDEKVENNQGREEDMEVIEGKCQKELEKLNECEREVEMVEELAHILELPIKLVEETDEQTKEVPDREADGHQNEAVGGQSQHLTLDDGIFMEHRCENMATQEEQEKKQIKEIEEHNQQGHFQSKGKDYLVEGEKQKNSCGDEEALDTWDLFAEQNHNQNLTILSLSDLTIDLGQLEEEIQPKPLTPERPPGFGVEIADGFSGTRELQTKGFGVLKPHNLLRGTNSCHPSGKMNLERHQEAFGQKKALEYYQTMESPPSGLVNLGSFKVEQQKMLPTLERPSKWLGEPTSEFQDMPSNLEKNTLDLVRDTISLFNPLNLEAVQQEHHKVLPNVKSSETQLATEELPLTLQQIKEEQRRQKQLKCKGRRNSECSEEMRNPGGSEKKHDQGKRIQSHANGKMAEDLTLNLSKVEKEKLAEVPNTVQESISKEQEQREELLAEPGVMIASCTLPRDQKHLNQEKQPYISKHRRPVDIDQVAVEESSQTTRMQRQLKRWNRSTSEQHDQRKKSKRGAKEVEIQEKFSILEKIGKEKQADVSYRGRPICLDLVSVEQEESVQQKLRCLQRRHPDDVAKSMLIGDLYPLSLPQDHNVLQPELPTPERPQELKDTQEGSSQIAGQHSKLRSWKRKNMLKQNVNAIVAEERPSSLALQPLHESKQTLEESNRTLGQRSTKRCRKRENRMEQSEEVDEHLYSPLAFLPPLLPAPQKSAELHNQEKPAGRKLGRPPKVKQEMHNSEAVLLIPTHSHCSKEAKEEEPKKYRVRERPPKPNGANALTAKKMKISKKQLRCTKSPRTRT